MLLPAESQAKREAMGVAASKAKGRGTAQPLWRAHLNLCGSYVLYIEFWDLFALGFNLILFPSLFSVTLFLPFRMEMFILYHRILNICNLVFIFMGAHSQEFALSLR